MFFWISGLFSLIFELEKNTPISQNRTLLSKTVIFIETEFYKRNFNGSWVPIDKKIPLKLKISYSEGRDWKNVDTAIAEYEKIGSFFFTAPVTNYYQFDISCETEEKDLGLGIRLYEGTSSQHKIISAVDSAITGIRNEIHRAIDVCKGIDEVQNIDHQNDEIFRKYLHQNYNIVLFSIIIKILFVLTFHYYLNKDVRNYFIQKKVVK